LLFGLPALVVISQSLLEWRANRSRRQLQKLAVQSGVAQSGYFRIGPYAAEERGSFDRADRAHVKVLTWVEHSAAMPLYVTGDSGCGKSSLLNAFVLPTLKEQGWTVVEARAWQDPEEALRRALSEHLNLSLSEHCERPSLRALIETVARKAALRLL